MYVIAKHTFVVTNPNSSAKERLVVRLSPDTQSVPDWVRDTDYYKLATKGGTLIEVIPVTPAAEVQQAEPENLGLEGGGRKDTGKKSDSGKKADGDKDESGDKAAK
jgi:hypothetical protein